MRISNNYFKIPFSVRYKYPILSHFGQKNTVCVNEIPKFPESGFIYCIPQISDEDVQIKYLNAIKFLEISPRVAISQLRNALESLVRLYSQEDIIHSCLNNETYCLNTCLFNNYKLSNNINSLVKNKKLLPSLAESLHLLRVFGNFATHSKRVYIHIDKSLAENLFKLFYNIFNSIGSIRRNMILY